MKYVFMCFNDGGGLEDWKIKEIKKQKSAVDEDLILEDMAEEYERETVGKNLGTFIAVLDEEEVKKIYEKLGGGNGESKS